MIPTEPVVALSGRRHARRVLARPQWSSVVDVGRAIVRDVFFTLAVLLAILFVGAGGMFGALAISFVVRGELALACLSVLAAVTSVVACRPALHFDARRAAREREK